MADDLAADLGCRPACPPDGIADGVPGPLLQDLQKLHAGPHVLHALQDLRNCKQCSLLKHVSYIRQLLRKGAPTMGGGCLDDKNQQVLAYLRMRLPVARYVYVRKLWYLS